MTAATVATLTRARRARSAPPAPTDPVTQYALDVVAGRFVTGTLVKKAAERHLRDLADGHKRGLFFDTAAAQHAIDFAPLLHHYVGEWAGTPIRLEAWEQFIVGAAFGWKRADGTRRFRSVYVEVAKKNGKTLLAAVIAILLAFFDNEPGAEVYSGATKRDQAKLSWNAAAAMVRRSPSLRSRIKIVGGMSGAVSMVQYETESFFRPLGEDADSDQGINVHGAIIDELHVHKDRRLIDNLETATAARRQPMTVKITTAGVKRESVWAEERADAVSVVEGRADDDSMLVLVYTLDEGDDPLDEAVWPKSNPNLGVSVSVESLREQAAKAARNPGAMGAFLRFRMNVPTSASTRALDIDEWDACSGRLEGETYEDWAARVLDPHDADGKIIVRYGHGGLDLASVKDLTAFILVLRDGEGTYDVLCRFWCPEDGVVDRSRRDGVPYDAWVRDGYLIATPGNVTDYAFVKAEIGALALRHGIGEIGFDRWNATQLAVEIGQEGATLVAIPQTHAGLGPAWHELGKMILDRTIQHGGHPILRWMAGNVEVEYDAAGNEKPSKRLSNERIDGMVALDMAVGRHMTTGGAVQWTAA